MNFYLRIAAIGFFWLSQSISVCAQDDDKFSLVREEDSIYVYERWIIFPDSNPPQDAREVKGEFYIHTTIPEALLLLKDENRIMKWQKHVSEFKVHPIKVDTAWLEYSYHDIPWPVSDQDHFLIYKIERSNDNEMFITFESSPNSQLAPVRSGVDRMNLIGSWTYQKISDTKIKVIYKIISQPSNIPRIFTDPIIRRNLMSTIKSYIRILEEEEL